MQEQLSDIIKEMISPYHDGNLDEIEILVSIAITAWNTSLLPKDASKELTNQFLSIFNHDKDIKELIDILITEKALNFPNDDRLIINHEIKENKDDWTLKIEFFSFSENRRYDENIPVHKTKKEPVNKNGSYIFTVKLATGLWRKIQIDKTASLDDLHYAIIDSFDFDDEHLYAFFMDNKAWSNNCFCSPYDEEGPDASEVQLFELGLKPKDKFLYIYDYGDEWRFSITVFKELETIVDEPKVVQVKGEAPAQYPDYDDDFEDYE
jgi:Plasmid pRiA4b ORF-3-like protein